MCLGIQYEKDGELKSLNVYVAAAVADAPMRALLQSMTQYNGYYGCGKCCHPGEHHPKVSNQGQFAQNSISKRSEGNFSIS